MRTGGALPGRDPVTIGDANLGFVPAGGGRPSGVNVFGVDAAWSPDGRRVAFVNYRDMNGLTCFAHGNLGRYLLGLDAARPRGGRRCFANGEIYVVDSDGRNARRLTSTLADDVHPSWSPDGSRIVFSSGFHTAGRPMSKLYVIPASGGEASLLFSPARGAALDPAWAPG
jgi:Tol biopolymer transport system component